VGLIEERCSVQREREKVEQDVSSVRGGEYVPGTRPVLPIEKQRRRQRRRLSVGAVGASVMLGGTARTNRHCRRVGSSRRGRNPGAKILSCVRTVAAVPPDAPLWVVLELRMGKVPALVDIGAQFSCVHGDVAEYLYRKAEPCTFAWCPVTCWLADGR
jgi:hypothetical protein